MPEPIVGVTYGPSGMGKSLDFLYSFPNALFLCQPGALKPAAEYCGYLPKHIKIVQRISDITETLLSLKPSDPQDIVVDDLSLIANWTWMLLEKKYNDPAKKFDVFRYGREEAFAMRHAARNSGRNVLMNAHDSLPHTNKLDGRFIRGGPQLPGKLPEELPSLFDLVLRCELDETRPFGWKVVYRCFVSGQHYMKDRDGICADTSPMNMREIMLAAGYKVPRLAGLEWMDEMVDKVKDRVFSKVDPSNREMLIAAVKVTRDTLAQSKHKIEDPRIQNWIIRDAYDRLLIQRNRAQKQMGPTSIWGA